MHLSHYFKKQLDSDGMTSEMWLKLAVTYLNYKRKYKFPKIFRLAFL